ncbi:hypothetical protein ACOSP7_019538 [Xanthoceras sorbifolium]
MASFRPSSKALASAISTPKEPGKTEVAARQGLLAAFLTIIPQPNLPPAESTDVSTFNLKPAPTGGSHPEFCGNFWPQRPLLTPATTNSFTSKPALSQSLTPSELQPP